MTTLVLDTHVALWWSFFPEKLSPTATRPLEEAETLVFPAIVFGRRRCWFGSDESSSKLTFPPGVWWWRGLRSSTRAKIVAVSAEIALRAHQLTVHDDPADRFIVATALRAQAPLVTRDAAIRSTKLVPTIW